MLALLEAVESDVCVECRRWREEGVSYHASTSAGSAHFVV